MAAPAYSLDAWRQFRARRESPPEPVAPPRSVTLADIPADAEMDDDIVIGFWNGERFVSWEKWIVTAPIHLEPTPLTAVHGNAAVYRALCGTTPVWLRRDGHRWLMFAGTQKSRRRDFASPFLEHTIRTAEDWYGPPAEGWQPGTHHSQASQAGGAQ